jgi:hypothetical protein
VAAAQFSDLPVAAEEFADPRSATSIVVGPIGERV